MVVWVAPARERGLKSADALKSFPWLRVAPARERGLKWFTLAQLIRSYSRSREGAWIEMLAAALHTANAGVAPARERGLKFIFVLPKRQCQRRSREGAWIEIALRAIPALAPAGRSREGAWIEIRY